ncbi:MAG: YqhV family protein [Novibacillus thermophilus]|jgi:hypothetical protein|uniref:DUF2619 domain-containing protein n=1 Tax=Novibacillus thermophilus TaxID=1471761 RepID=A0A1U9K927_9BACL|nr:YqhV family protein [Novibacillus thermophilus]AQS56542.1 hypothetical protein B0W44_13010 [Novibacillus thermophilus]
MWFIIEKVVLAMGTLRIISGFIEMTAGFLMLKFNDLEKSIAINALLALVGPAVLITTTTIGLAGLVERVSYDKVAWIAAGVVCILIGVFKG